MGFANFGKEWTMKYRRPMAIACKSHLKALGFKKVEITGSFGSGCMGRTEEIVSLTADGQYFCMGYLARFSNVDGSLTSVSPPECSADNVLFFIPQVNKGWPVRNRVATTKEERK